MKPIRRPFHPCLHTCIRRHGARALGATACTVLALAVLGSQRATAADLTWQGGNVDWIDGGSIFNWNPNDEPDSDDTAIFITSNNVNLGSNNSILALTMSGGISLDTNDFDLTLNGLLQLVDTGTDLTVGGSTSLLSADSVAINTDASIIMQGGTITVVEESGDGFININSGGTFTGNGVINLNDALVAGTTLMTLSGGVLTATSNIAGDLFGTTASTLTINVADADGRIDLDNVSPTVNVFRNDTLDINGTSHDSSDPFGGTLNLNEGSTIDMSVAWQMNAGNINANTGGILVGSAGSPATIAGAAFTLGGGSINLGAVDSLRFSSPFTTTAGTIANAGLVIFNAATTVGAGTDFQMIGAAASLTVETGVQVNIDDADFDADANGTVTNVITINSGGILDLDLGLGGETGIGSTINLNGGELDVTTDSNTWSITRSVTVGAATGISQINGETLTFTSLTSVPVTVGDGSTLDVNAVHTWGSGSSLSIGSGATAELGNATFNSPGTISGAGQLRCIFNSTVSGSTTIGVNHFDWDGTATVSTHTIAPGAVLTINSPVFDGDGDMDDAVILGGSGGGIMMNGPASWTMLNTLDSNDADLGVATIGGTSRMMLETATGILNANGDTTISAPVTFGALSATNVAAPAVLTVNGNAIFGGGNVSGAGSMVIGSTSTVSASTTVATGTFDWDGGGIGSLHTINDSAVFTISSAVFDSDGDMDDPISLGGSGAGIAMSGPVSWEMKGALTANPADVGIATIGGTSRMVLTTATGILNANGDTTISAPVTFGALSATNVAAPAVLTVNGNAIFGGGNVSGAGSMVIGSTSTVSASTTVATGTLDWDGGGIGSLHTINDSAVFTINSAVFDSDGDMDDPISLGGSGAGIAMSGPVSWEMKGALTANPADVGIATIGGTSRMVLTTATGILNANGDTTISAPVTFGALSTTNIAAPAVLTVTGNAIYDGGIITGAGNFNPPSGANNTVSASSMISTSSFDFDLGSWLVEAEATLTVNVTDYDNAATNAFDNSITIQSGRVSMTTGDPEFVMNSGTLTLSNTTGTQAVWSGEPLVVGSDTGALDANLNVTGTGISQIVPAVTFKSDADIDIAAGTQLQFLSSVDFDTVNGANNAEFTGLGVLFFSRTVNVNEAATLNMTGGTVDLDGNDAVGDFINIDAPFVINAATLRSFGTVNAGGGTNILDVNHSIGSGVLTVNLDNPADEWTLNAPGVMNLVNDNTAATLLAGSDSNVLGEINVTGDVRSDARLDIGFTGVVNILTAAEPFRLAGGDNTTSPNTIAGGTISGPGLLSADSGSALTGFGTFTADANIDFDGNADLLANDGTLTVHSTILDARNVGTAEADGTLNVVNAWTAPAGSTVLMQGGLLQGGTLTLNNTDGMVGHGTVSAQVINNTVIHANSPGNTLLLSNTLNDWDGTDAPEDGILRANGGILECIDNATFFFDGTIHAFGSGTVFSNGFAFTLVPASTLSLDSGGTYKSTSSTDIRGTVTVGAGADSTIEILSGGELDFEATSTTNLTGNLRLATNNGVIRAGATFGGAGSLIIPSGSILKPENGVTANVLVKNEGQLSNAGTAVGDFSVKDYQQTASGKLEIDMHPASRDRVIASVTAQLAGDLVLKLGGGYVPVLNDTFSIVTATGGVSGTFGSIVQPVGMPAGLVFQANYFPTFVELKVVASNPFETWIDSFVSLTDPADKTKQANPDGDGLNNLGEFALDGDPTSGVSSGKIVGKIAPVGGVDAMTLTIPVRSGAVLDPGDPAGGELVLEQTTDVLTYRIQATDDLAAFTLEVTEVTGPDATAIQAGLPALNAGWVYRTFRSPGPVAGDPAEFMRTVISE